MSRCDSIVCCDYTINFIDNCLRIEFLYLQKPIRK